MSLRNRIAAVAAALSLVLAVAPATLAANTNGTTTESLSIASTISMTVPASIAYPGGKVLNSASVAVTVATDNPAGLTVGMTANADGAGKITLASRSEGAPVIVGNALQPGTAAPAGSISATVPWTVAFSLSNHADRTATFDSFVDATTYAVRSYTGSLNFTASTN